MTQDTFPETIESAERPVESDVSKPKLLDQVRQAIRARHYSKRTEKDLTPYYPHGHIAIFGL